MSSLSLADIEAAAGRIAGMVRQTPVLPAELVNHRLGGDYHLDLKLECLQVTGSFKARGACSKATGLGAAELGRGLVTASGGNHGLGVAYAGRRTETPVTIFLPANSPAAKAEAIGRWGAEVIHHGEVWDEANLKAMELAERTGMTYAHAFADPLVIAGQGTLGLEIMGQLPDCDVVLVAIGGGGLISGVATAVKAIKPSIQVIGIEPVGAPTLYDSLKAGQVVTLQRIETSANTLAPKRSDAVNFEIIRHLVDDIVLVDDEQMRLAAGWLWREFGVAAELSGAAAVAALMSNAYVPAPGARICAIICGAGSDGLSV